MKAKNEHWWLDQKTSRNYILFSLFVLFLPTQFGKHFWPAFSIVTGLRVDYLSPTIYLTDVIIICLFFSWLVGQGRRSFILLRKRHWSVEIFFIMLGLVILQSVSPLAGLYGLVKLVEFWLLGLYVVTHLSTKFIFTTLPRLFGFAILFESLLAIGQFFQQASIGSIFYFFGERTFSQTTPGIANTSLGGTLLLRPYATFSHPNVLAAYLLFGIILVWQTMRFAKQPDKWKIFLRMSILLSSVALLLTLSRTAILLWVVFWLLQFLLPLFRKQHEKRVKSLVMGITGLLGMVLVFFPLLLPRFSLLNLADESVTIRWQLMVSAWQIFVSHPLFGVGLNNFLVALPSYYHPSGQIFVLQPVHNIFLLLLSEIGMIGFLFVSSFLFKTVKHLSRQPLLLQALCFPLLLVCLLLGLTDHYFFTLQQGQLLLTLVLGLCWMEIKEL